jgi:hypothetical protein
MTTKPLREYVTIDRLALGPDPGTLQRSPVLQLALIHLHVLGPRAPRVVRTPDASRRGTPPHDGLDAIGAGRGEKRVCSSAPDQTRVHGSFRSNGVEDDTEVRYPRLEFGGETFLLDKPVPRRSWSIRRAKEALPRNNGPKTGVSHITSTLPTKSVCQATSTGPSPRPDRRCTRRRESSRTGCRGPRTGCRGPRLQSLPWSASNDGSARGKLRLSRQRYRSIGALLAASSEEQDERQRYDDVRSNHRSIGRPQSKSVSTNHRRLYLFDTF